MREGLKYFGGLVGALLAVLLIGAVITVGVFAISWLTAKPSGKLNARHQILSGNNRIAQYNHFFALCASVKTLETAIDASKAQLKEETDNGQKAIIRTNITAQIASRADAVNTYNADASNTYDAGQFLAFNLPYQLSLTIPQGGTTCAR